MHSRRRLLLFGAPLASLFLGRRAGAQAGAETRDAPAPLRELRGAPGGIASLDSQGRVTEDGLYFRAGFPAVIRTLRRKLRQDGPITPQDCRENVLTGRPQAGHRGCSTRHQRGGARRAYLKEECFPSGGTLSDRGRNRSPAGRHRKGEHRRRARDHFSSPD